jgi:non-ribosomal peptide synthetase-like protein
MRPPSIASADPERPAGEAAFAAQEGTRASLLFVFEPLQKWARETPSKVAIVSEGVSWTYAELDSETNRLARALAARGVQKGDRVAFVLPRGPETVLLLISILKAGASYVPLDSESPPSRVRECLEDAKPSLVVGLWLDKPGVLSASLEDLDDEIEQSERQTFPEVSLEDLRKEARSQSTDPLRVDGLTPDDLAYVIFTSGTTGRPKGVPIKHASLSNFVWGDQEVCIRVEPEDRVFQGFSPASDGHHEEVWPTLLAGATLVVATSREIHSGPELYALLAGHEVTIISCAPTLLSMVEQDVPTLRRILFGAENRPAATVARWWRPGREIINTYGPTEATVGATFGYCEPKKPISIGQPLPGYFCYVLDETQQPVSDGQEGELWIAGVGVSDGYFGRPDLTAQRFLLNPYLSPTASEASGSMYRTGDRVRRDESGNLYWLGRVDAQIKIRGHRVELSEIEGHLLTDPSVSSGVVVTRELADQQVSLVALLALRDAEAFDLGVFLEKLRADLPAYMVPSSVELVDKIPVLPSGKVDRRACQALKGRPVRIERAIVPPRSEAEMMILQAWQELFHTTDISCTDDFFTDLGGYSLLASRFVSFLRGEKGYPQISVLNLYEHPTIRSFAALLESQQVMSEALPPFRPIGKWRYRKAKAVQAIGILVLFGIQGVFWLGPIIAAIYFSNNGHSDLNALLLGLTISALTVPALLLLTIALKWIVGGKFKEGRYPLWGTTFLRWWFVDRMLAMSPATVLTGTPLASLYLRALGAKIGRNVTLESIEISCPDLIEIGDDCSLENSAWLHPDEVARGELHMRPIKIGRGCMIGVRSGVAGGGTLEEGVTLRDLTCVSTGMRVGAYEEWGGSPAKKVDDPKWEKYDPNKQPSRAKVGWFAAAQAVLAVVLTYIESLPFIAVAFWMYNSSEGFLAYLQEPLFAVALVGIACVQALIVKWLVIGKLRAGSFPNPGLYALRKWFTDKHLELVSAAIVPVYDSLFARAWCMALGMKCGPRCEIALPRRLPYDLVTMGEESFWASEVSIGMPFRRNGEIRLEHTTIGNRAFLGNDSVMPQGVHVPDECLMGVLSLWPPQSETGLAPGQAWLGSPAFQLPQRQRSDQFDVALTYRPTKRLYAERLVHEAFRIVLPSLCSLIVASIIIESFVWLWNETSLGWAIAAGPILYLFGALLGAGLCWLAKLVLVGRYKANMSPLWSPFVWKAETYSSVLHDFGATMFIRAIEGTPYLATLMRFLGAKIGRRAFINTSDWTETDLIQIGEDAAINANAPLQAHLFEDRVMKMGPIKVGDRASIGNYSVVLGDSEVRQDAQVGHMSLVMKGETIPAGTYWSGSPAQSGVLPPLPERSED